MNNLILLIISIIPSIFLLNLIYKKDEIEKEPITLLILLFISGIICTFITLLLSKIMKTYFEFLNNPYEDLDQFETIFKIVINIALIEEFTKWLMNYFITWKNKEFNYSFDAIVYAVFVSLGFATFENIFYVFDYGFLTAIFRAITSIPGHACFGVFMGSLLGLAKLNQNDKFMSKTYKFLSLIIPILLHSIYDILAINKLILQFIIFIIILYILSIMIINKFSKNEKILTN